jgi:hypothetical protein
MNRLFIYNDLVRVVVVVVVVVVYLSDNELVV